MNNRKTWAAIALTMLAASVTSCSLDGRNREHESAGPLPVQTGMELTRAELEIVSHSNEFAFNLFRQISVSENAVTAPKSIIVSPISITFALGMLNNGAANDTQAQINKVLGFEKTGADSINAFCSKMLNSAPKLDSLTKVLIANTIYLNKGYNLKPVFLQKAKSFYNAEPETRDFNDGQTMDVINRWAGDHTGQMIQKVLDEQTFEPNAVSYLLNAIYFKGTWTRKFDIGNTVESEFHHAGSTKEKVLRPMMRQTVESDYAESDDFQALSLPYGNGSFRMTVLLPKTGKGQNLNALPPVPTAESWLQLCRNMHAATVDVCLPRFETNTDIDLKKIMSSLGMPDAFDRGKADFSNFCDRPTYIGLMKQVARIKLDEEGSEAAAVTVIGMRKNSIGDSGYITFNANHPFLYIISEQSTGAVFFIGRYTGE